jgi:hypothetical protein
MSANSEEIIKHLKDDSQNSTDLEVKVEFDRNSCISINFPSLKQVEQENPVTEIFLDYFNGAVSILIYRENDENPETIPIAENSQRKKL